MPAGHLTSPELAYILGLTKLQVGIVGGNDSYSRTRSAARAATCSIACVRTSSQAPPDRPHCRPIDGVESDGAELAKRATYCRTLLATIKTLIEATATSSVKLQARGASTGAARTVGKGQAIFVTR